MPAEVLEFPPESRYPLQPGVHSRQVVTTRLRQHIYESGPIDGPRVLLIHGNASSARFYEELQAQLPAWHCVAPDLRGYGATEPLVVDATRGLRDFSDDLDALVNALGWERFHLLGWSLGGSIATQYTIDHPDRILTLTLQAPGSPYGYGASHGPDGQPNYPDDYAGSGAGLINPEVVARFLAKDDSADSPFAPRAVMRHIYVHAGFTFAPDREDILTEAMLTMRIGDHYYPGDKTTSPHWPFVAPGLYGANNALSPKYRSTTLKNPEDLATMSPQPPILWVRGADDQVVSDAAMLDIGTLGKLEIVPGWPGEAIFPPQPMLAQTRALLDRYRANGGHYVEMVYPECGHSPHIEHAERFRADFTAFMERSQATQSAARSSNDVAPSQPDGGKQRQRRRGPLDFLFRRG